MVIPCILGEVSVRVLRAAFASCLRPGTETGAKDCTRYTPLKTNTPFAPPPPARPPARPPFFAIGSVKNDTPLIVFFRLFSSFKVRPGRREAKVMAADRGDRAHAAAVRAAGREHGPPEAAVTGAAAPPARLHLRLGRVPRYSFARGGGGGISISVWSFVVEAGRSRSRPCVFAGGCLDGCGGLEPITELSESIL